jgi:hypothetical protein
VVKERYVQPFQENNKGLDEFIDQEDGISPESSWIKVLIEHLAAA